MADERTNYVTVKVDDKKCTRCYDCVELCPTSALTLDKGIFLHDSDKCAYDEVCQDVCPEQAITILWK